MVALIDLHRVAKRAGRARHDGDFLHGRGVALQRRDERVTDFVVGHDALFLVGENRVLLLIAGDNDLDGFLHVRLRRGGAVVADSAQGGFIDDVRQFRAGCAGRHARNLRIVDVRLGLNLLRVDAEDGFATLQIRQLHGHAAVKTAGAGQRGVKGFGTVRRGEDDNAVAALEAVHLGQQLVERLFALVVAAAELAAVALLADGVDFVNKHDAGRFLLRLLEQVAHLAGAHADEHLHKFRAGNGEERHVRFARDCLGEHGFACAGRADEQNALGHRRADIAVL